MHVRLALFLPFLLLAPAALAAVPVEPVLLLPEEGPTLPGGGSPTIVTVYSNDVWAWDGGVHHHTFVAPAGSWSRVVVELTVTPAGDPWDRLFGVALGNVEILRGTTPRVAMTVDQEVTRYASLLSPGSTVDVYSTLSSYAGALLATLKFRFYPADDPTASAAEHAFEHAIGAYRWAGHCANGNHLATTVAFPPSTPTRAVVELTTTGHGGDLYVPLTGPPNSNSEEFWYTWSPVPRVFHVLVDGTDVARAVAMPYTYALAGFSSTGGGSTNTAVWWTAQKGLDLAGVHPGTGQVPAYRLEMPPATLPLLSGSRTVELYAENGACVWISSLSFLSDG